MIQAGRAPDAIWEEAVELIRSKLATPIFRSWFESIRIGGATEETLTLLVPSRFAKEWIEPRYLPLISGAVSTAAGREMQILLEIGDIETTAPAHTVAAPTQKNNEPTFLNARYAFDTYVTGPSNRFAHAAALAVAEAPAQAYNPLFIYGGTGLGKTHLLQAIAGYAVEHSRHLSTRYVTSETFMNDFINSLRDKRIEGFKQRYRHYDLLLIDDIQFFEHKERIQEEFFHTFNTLYEAGRQIVISSDRPPRAIATLEARLRSRFEWGLITDIQAPDLETRIAILRKKVKTDGIHVPDSQVLTFIASRISTNIRELEGALTRVVAFSSLTGRPMNVELAQEVLQDVFPQGEPPEVSVERIQETVIERFGISMQELVGDRRSQAIVYPRQVAMYLCRELTDSSLPKIGKKFGGRDHTTVIHATSKIAKLIREDRNVYNLVQELTARIKQAR